MFDFEAWHILGQKHNAEDEPFRRPLTAADIAEAETGTDIDDFILVELNSLRVSPICLDKPTSILADKHSDNP